jgi:hypothetical protein
MPKIPPYWGFTSLWVCRGVLALLPYVFSQDIIVGLETSKSLEAISRLLREAMMRLIVSLIKL